MPWFRRGSRFVRRGYRSGRKFGRKAKKWNKRYKVAGWTPDYVVSPFEGVPYVGQYREGKMAYDALQDTAMYASKGARNYRKARKTKSRRGASSSTKQRRNRRGTKSRYYYYRGRRYDRYKRKRKR